MALTKAEWIERMPQLRALWMQLPLLSTAEIGRRMGLSKNAIVGAAHRSDLPSRPNPTLRDPNSAYSARVAKPQRTVGATLPPLTSIAADIFLAPSPIVEAPPLVQAVSSGPRGLKPIPATPDERAASRARAIRLSALARSQVVGPTLAPLPIVAIQTPRPIARIKTCCWPIGEPGTREFRFCDDASIDPGPYCQAHRDIAYTRFRPRHDAEELERLVPKPTNFGAA